MTTRTGKSAKVGDMNRGELETLIAEAVAAAILPLSSRIDKLCSEVEKLKEELTEKDTKIKLLESSVHNKCDELEQYGRRNNIRIFGVPEANSENTDDLVIDVARKINVTLEKWNIDRSHRVGKAGGDRPRPILVKFTSYGARRAVFQAKKQLKSTRITIREDLTQARLSLMRKTMDSYSEKNVWSSDGAIMVKVGAVVRPLRVRTEEDLASLLVRHPPVGV
ncbi:uncharacterized protein LOC127751197 [Frankliniella occidentalis]|uniref:Uncharacterized protein LOC127751197 n=1 Tax=Frankliniella occidentalis TaxID=133901 RepID=A0A9C6X721_FRAOC|nr:uncharacterized protein LOC127751197 [Frankliniella occidentalis]